MKVRSLLFVVFLMSLGVTAGAFAQDASARNLVTIVRSATEKFKNVEAAKAAGYALFHGCVSGQTEGSMGIHYANGDLVADGELDPEKPEALLYESRNGKMQLLGVEYVVLAEAWNAKHKTPPVLAGQLFNLNGAPNRYGLPAFYELHVWAWKTNPRGTFADFNPSVTCDSFAAGEMSHGAMHGSN